MLHMPTVLRRGAGSVGMDGSLQIGAVDVLGGTLEVPGTEEARRPAGPVTPLRAPGAPAKQVDPLKAQLTDCARESGGPASARVRAAALGEAYRAMPGPDRLRFMQTLAHDFGPDPKAIAKAHAAYVKAAGTADQWETETRLRQAVISPRSKILRQFNELPDGLKFLVDLRADVLKAVDAEPALAVLDRELQNRLSSWFDVGFLELTRITWDSPAALLEKLMAYEAVHQIRSWNDLKNRLDSDRRCYAFFHPRMPREPLVFVEVALTSGISRDVQPLLDESAPVLDPGEANTAIFYSISNTQAGLRGVSLGNFLLKRVIEALRRDLPGLQTFSTLSPLPTFRLWLDQQFAKDSVPLERADLLPLADALGGPPTPLQLQQTLQKTRWSEMPELIAALERPMNMLGLHYLTKVKQGQLPFDPVARFHLGNGARIERLNWAADISAKGFNQSYSMMVNYRYLPESIEDHVDRYGASGEIVVGPQLAAA
jgi:malonyl-CoA decarboxylase